MAYVQTDHTRPIQFHMGFIVGEGDKGSNEDKGKERVRGRGFAFYLDCDVARLK